MYLLLSPGYQIEILYTTIETLAQLYFGNLHGNWENYLLEWNARIPQTRHPIM